MEAKEPKKDQPAQEPKLSYNDLKDALNQMYKDYERLMNQYRGAVQALNNIDSTGFFLHAAFSVMEHHEMYSSDFVENLSKKIEFILTKYASAMEPDGEPQPEKESEA